MGVFGMRFDDTEGFMLKCIQLQRGQAMFPNVCEKSADIVGVYVIHKKQPALGKLKVQAAFEVDGITLSSATLKQLLAALVQLEAVPAFVFAADAVGAAGTLPAVAAQDFAIRQGFDGCVKIVIRVAGALGFTYGLACAVHCKHGQAV